MKKCDHGVIAGNRCIFCIRAGRSLQTRAKPRAKPSTASASVCIHRGDGVGKQEVSEAGYSPSRDHYRCGHPTPPEPTSKVVRSLSLGIVSDCRACASQFPKAPFCGPGCDGYVAEPLPSPPLPPPLDPRVGVVTTPVSNTVARFDATDFGPGDWFNAGLIEWGNGYLMAVRRQRGMRSEVYLVRLDAEFKPTSAPCRRLDLWHPRASDSQEDPRLFLFREQLHLSFVGVSSEAGKPLQTSVLYARLTDDLEVEEVYYPHYPQRNHLEKNWAFFEADDTLFAVYSIAPHRILKIDGDTATLAHTTPNDNPWKGGGEPRGGASPVRIGGVFHHWFHSRSLHSGQTRYELGCYTFSAAPPFAIVGWKPEPVEVADPATCTGRTPVVFPCGAIRRGTDWLVSMGIHDKWVELRTYPQPAFTYLIPPRWHWPDGGKPWETGQWEWITGAEHDEYGLARLDLRGGVILDIGAYAGTFAYAALAAGAERVVCYEPDPIGFWCIERNLGGRVEICAEAVGEPGTGEVSRVSEESTSNTVAPSAGGRVPIVSLDTILDDVIPERIRLLKLDCEGGEWPALMGCSDAGLRRIENIAGEYHRAQPGQVDELRAKLEAAGFACWFSEPDANGTGAFRAKSTRKESAA